MTPSIADFFLVTKSDKQICGGSKPKKVCRLAVPKSASIRRTSFPLPAKQIPMLTAIRLLPVPPFPPPMASI